MRQAYHPDLLAAPVPRYTSYPTAAEFQEGVGGAELGSALAGVASDELLSLYVHIPYCHEICWYCGCNTGAANKAQRLAAYLDALEREIDSVATKLEGRGKGCRIAFGGGSPNALFPKQFERILALVKRRFAARKALISLEFDPRSLNARWFDAIARSGIERASVGVQTLDPAIQARIGRVQGANLIEASVEKLRRAGVRSLNFDLMYGLPGQGLAELRSTLDATLSMRPDRIALFGYAHLPNVIARQRRIDASCLPDLEQRFDQAALGARMILEAGYVRVGFDHFALPSDPLAIAAGEGRLRRNFQGFTDDPCSTLIGLGASAISAFPRLLVQNEKNAGRYRMKVSSGQLAADRGIVRTKADQDRARVIEQLLCNGSADIGKLDAAVDDARLATFVSRGLIRFDGPAIVLTDAGWPYARVIAAMFDSFRQPVAQRFSSAI